MYFCIHIYWKVLASKTRGDEKFVPHITGNEDQTFSCRIGNGSNSGGVKQPVRGFNHPLPSRGDVKENVQLIIYSTFGL